MTDPDPTVQLRFDIEFYTEQIEGFERNAREFDQRAIAARTHATSYRSKLAEARTLLARAEDVDL